MACCQSSAWHYGPDVIEILIPNSVIAINTAIVHAQSYLHSMHVKPALVPFSFEDHIVGWSEGLIPSRFVHLGKYVIYSCSSRSQIANAKF